MKCYLKPFGRGGAVKMGEKKAKKQYEQRDTIQNHDQIVNINVIAASLIVKKKCRSQPTSCRSMRSARLAQKYFQIKNLWTRP